MTIAIHQPKFLPYIGYWQLINSVETFVILDDVNFVKKAYINHNFILIDEKLHKFSLELKSASQNKLINQIEIGKNSLKILKTIELNYKKKPYFKKVFPILEDIFSYKEKNLAKFIGHSLEKICNYCEIKTNLVYSSTINKNNNLKAQNKIIEICQKLNIKNYIQVIGGKDLYDKNKFIKKNINISFLDTKIKKYNQSKYNFTSHLSIIDIMMHNSKDVINDMLNNYKLI